MTRSPVIVAGAPAYGVWCPDCQSDTRIRVPLHLGDVGRDPAAQLTICTACGQGYMPTRPVIRVDPATRRWPVWRPWLAFLWWLHRRQARKTGRPPTSCGYGECLRPGWWECAWIEAVDGGRVRHVFCGGSHRAQWLGAYLGITAAVSSGR